MTNPKLDSILEGRNAVKDIIGSLTKLEYGQQIDNSIITVLLKLMTGYVREQPYWQERHPDVSKGKET